MNAQLTLPKQKQPTLRVITEPNDANEKGDIFGGWLMSMIDRAGAVEASTISKGPVSTVAVKELQFIKPLFVGDLVSFYTEIIKIGHTSITVAIEVFANRDWDLNAAPIKISDATFVYVAVSEPGMKRPINVDGA